MKIKSALKRVYELPSDGDSKTKIEIAIQVSGTEKIRALTGFSSVDSFFLRLYYLLHDYSSDLGEGENRREILDLYEFVNHPNIKNILNGRDGLPYRALGNT